MTERIIITGAGLAGCLLAVQLGQAGYDVLVLERRSDPRTKGEIGGRSINLAISERGLAALDRAGLKQKVLEGGVRMPGRMIHTESGPLFQPYSRQADRAINSVSRSGLNFMLLEAADALPNVNLAFDRPCIDVDPDRGVVTCDTPEGLREDHTADLIVGSDGAYSAVRQVLQKIPPFDFSQEYLPHGYKELTIPAVTEGPHAPYALEPLALHIWPHGGSMMIALPNLDGSFTCTLFWPYEGDHGFDALADASPESIREFFAKHYSSAEPLMPDLEVDFCENPTSPLVTIRCRPWSRGKAVLLGDAAHAIVPFYGQGANAAFEDCNALADALATHTHDIPKAISTFESARIDNANAIADLAIMNFLEMRDHTGSRIHRLQKKGSQFLGKIIPFCWTPLYDMVSFSTIPYATALKKSQRQSFILKSICMFVIVIVAMLILRQPFSP